MHGPYLIEIEASQELVSGKMAISHRLSNPRAISVRPATNKEGDFTIGFAPARLPLQLSTVTSASAASSLVRSHTSEVHPRAHGEHPRGPGSPLVPLVLRDAAVEDGRAMRT